MENQNWNQIGKEIKDIVQDAVNSQDFRQLNETVTDTVRQAMEQVGEGIRKATSNMEAAQKRAPYVDPDPAARERSQRRSSGVPHGAGTMEDESRVRFTNRWVNMPKTQPAVQPFARVTGIRSRAYAKTILGGLFAGGFGVGLLLSLIVLIMEPSVRTFSNMFPFGIFLVLTGGCVGLFCKGLSELGSLNRFRNYTRLLKDRSYFELKELAQRTGKSLEYMKKDIKNMLKKGWFTEGRLDEKETCLIVTKEAYAQYQTTQREYEEKKRREALFPSKEKELTKEVQNILDEGNAYLEQIHCCNERIPGEEISQKISRMEFLVRRIFEQVKKKPEAADDLKKMMSYYLPTTVKLLDAYADMDGQPVQGENISTAKKEIEETLDTLNTAFEKLLDEIFKDLAWDVSTDISVLHTLLAQEGLTKDTIKGDS